MPPCPHHPSHLIGAVASWEAHFQPPPLSPHGWESPLPAPAASEQSYFFTFGYFISAMAFVASICFSFKCCGHMLSTQSTRST